MPAAPKPSPAWTALQQHRQSLSGFSLRAAFESDPGRFSRLSLSLPGMLVDWSKHLVIDESLRLLDALAAERGVAPGIEALFAGDRCNFTEDRPALHTALRGHGHPDVQRVLHRMRAFCEDAHAGRMTGATGKPFSDVVSIGIGGSHLGPALACDALPRLDSGGMRVRFLSNIDGHAVDRALDGLDPASTLVFIVSKTFTTAETIANARAVRAWLTARLGEAAVVRHFCAVTADAGKAKAFGIPAEQTFEFWDWVGGRFSLWSAVGLPIALSAGWKAFDALLAGARDIDAHFRTALPDRNLPLILALLDVWYGGFHGTAARAVVPYDERLRLLPSYLQQLEMESLGKRTTRDGRATDHSTGAVVWGTAGTDGQHAYFQLLHQGTQLVPVDFIACCRPAHALPEHHSALLANCFAQSEALARGKTETEVRSEMLAQGRPLPEIERLLPHRVFPGDRPSTTFLLDELTPRALGTLIAMYEHKVYVESVVWGINAFDQWGVELGKQLAGRILPELGGGVSDGHDASTAGLIDYFRKHQQE